MTRWNYHSNVADVLSLGPRTAGKLMQVGVRTARELLQAKPHALAARLQEQQFAVDLIAAWQREAQLLLELPELDADAARVLAALGYCRKEAIARTTPTELLATWESALREQPQTSWLRQRPRPSVSEVNSWIQQAHASSPARAA